MKRIFAMLLFMAILCITPAQAIAENVLISAPLYSWDGDFICNCTNLTKNPIEIEIDIRTHDGLNFLQCSNLQIPSGGVGLCVYEGIPPKAVNCMASRTDGKSVKNKQIVCTLQTLDNNFQPTAFVPVDIKFKR